MSDIDDDETYFAENDFINVESPEKADRNGQNSQIKKGERNDDNGDEPPAKRNKLDMGK